MPTQKKKTAAKKSSKASKADGEEPKKKKQAKEARQKSKGRATSAVKSDTVKKPFPIVGIGASAGGLETLKVFFSSIPSDADIAFVVIQHLSPQHKSIMSSLLGKFTRMPVREIQDGMGISPNCVYLNPPDKNVAVFNRTLHLMEPIKSDGINLPIDFFFRSLSEDQKEKAVGIIVSGTASDGTLGIKAIKAEGGMAMVEDPATAKYDGMPRNAVKTGLVDFILPVGKMPEALIAYLKHPLLKSPGKTKTNETDTKNQLQKVFTLIRSATGHDFSQYKQSTIRRRIERRLAVHQIEKLSDYIFYMQKDSTEIQALFKDLLIGVTNFFRDPEAYQVLGQKVLPDLLQGKKPDTALRCWVVGCSTGEEAYSLAIIVSEVMEKLNKFFNVQIFATDIDEAAIDNARRGVFPDSIAADVSKKRLSQFFTKGDGIFKIKKQIRDMVVFSLQNVINDPPFSRLDLVSCRNLMIYMDTALQKKIIPLLHYTLNPGGILLLGTSESIGGFTDLFQPLDTKFKIYQCKETITKGIIAYPPKIRYGNQERIEADQAIKMPAGAEIQALAEKAILDEYAPTGVLINDKYEILHFVGSTGNYLMPPTGKPSFNILDMVRKDLKYQLTMALRKAVREKKRTACKRVRIKDKDSLRVVDIAINPLTDKNLPGGLLLVIFKDKTPEPAADENPALKPEGNTGDPVVDHLEKELQSTREYLQATIEELETSNEELKSTNEEMQSVNEELQSANEELETSKEELQSTNEELSTVNAELQHKVDELTKVQDDMHNLMAATDIASIFLDTSLHIKGFTPAAAQIIKLIPADIGRPVGDLKSIFAEIELAEQAKKVLNDLNALEMEIMSKDKRWYLLKVNPYRSAENVIKGVVMTVIDIHKIKQAEKVRRLATVLEDANDAITVQDFEGRILAWNKGAENLYGLTESEALKMNIADLIPEEKRKENQSLIDRIKKGEPILSFKTQRMTKDGKILNIWLTATALADKNGRIKEMSTTERNLAWLPEN